MYIQYCRSRTAAAHHADFPAGTLARLCTHTHTLGSLGILIIHILLHPRHSSTHDFPPTLVHSANLPWPEKKRKRKRMASRICSPPPPLPLHAFLDKQTASQEASEPTHNLGVRHGSRGDRLGVGVHPWRPERPGLSHPFFRLWGFWGRSRFCSLLLVTDMSSDALAGSS